MVKPPSGPPSVDTPLSPFRMLLCPQDNGLALVKWTQAIQPGPTNVRGGIPAPELDGSNTPKRLPIASVVSQIRERFFVIGEADTCKGRSEQLWQ